MEMELFVVRVLGPLEVRRDGVVVPIGGPEGPDRRSRCCSPTGRRSCRSTGSPTRSGATSPRRRPSPPSRATSPGSARRSRPRSRSLARAPGYVLDGAARQHRRRAASSCWSPTPTTARSPAAVVELLVERALALWRGAAFEEFARPRLGTRRSGATGGAAAGRARDAASRHASRSARPARWSASSSGWSSIIRCASASGASSWWPCTAPAGRREALRHGERAAVASSATSSGSSSRRRRGSSRTRIIADDPTLLADEPRPAHRRGDASRPRAALARRDPVRRAATTTSTPSARSLERERLVTLVGPGGVGKTRLALRLAAMQAADDGARAVRRRARARRVTSAAAVQAVAAALDVQQRQHLTLEATLVEFLRDRDMLIVLDNCEHLVDTLAPFVDRVRTACPGVTCSPRVASRSASPVSARGRSRPLGASRRRRPSRAGAIADVRGGAAVRRPRDRRRRPAFALTADNAAAIAEICRRARRPAARARARGGADAHAGPDRARRAAAASARTCSARRSVAPTTATGRCATRSNGRTSC